MNEKEQHYRKALEKKKEQKEFQQLRCVADLEKNHRSGGINFTSSDFLGLSQHPYVKKMTIRYVLEWGAGTTPHRLVTKHLECHRSVEEKLATLVGKEECLLFPSAHKVHEHILSAILNDQTEVFIDRYCHHTLLQAVGNTGARIFRYEHNDLQQLSSLLEKKEKKGARWIVTESLFGIDGKESPLRDIGVIGEQYGALVYVDDANSVGMLGRNGMGLGAHRKGIDLLFGSFGKHFGTFGAYVATSQLLRDYLLTFQPQLMEITMLPPAVLGAISASIDLIPDMGVEREKIYRLAAAFRKELIEKGWNTGQGTSHIIPLACSSEQECEFLSRFFLEQSILTLACKPPLVPQGGAYIGLQLTAQHSENHLSFFLETLDTLSRSTAPSTV